MMFNERPSFLFSANGSRIQIIGSIGLQLSLCFSGLTIYHEFKVATNITHDMILGSNFLSENKAVIDYNSGIISLEEDLVRVPLQSDINNQNNCVVAKQPVCIPAFSEMLVPVKVPKFYRNRTVLLEPISTFQLHKFACAKSFSKCNGNETICQILNLNPYALVLKRGTRVARIEDLNSIASIQPFQDDPHNINSTIAETAETLENFCKDYAFDLNPDLNRTQRLQLLQLLYNYKDVFARDIKDIKPCKNYQMDIELLSNRKMFRRQYRLHPSDSEEAERQINDMLQASVIEPSESADYNSPIFLVAKKNGSKRLVIDLRGLNSIIAPKLVQLQKIDELLQDVTSLKPKYMSLTDLAAGFWQFSIKKEARHLTSFTAPNGVRWQFCRAPFGLSSSPAAMLTALTNIFAGRKRYRGIFLYMDDILCVGTTWEDHLQNLKVMFENLRSNSLSCNPTKCSFAYSEIEYLGFRISAESIKISERKLKAIKDIAPPKNVKSLQRLLGMFNFWRHYVPRFAHNTVHMRRLRKFRLNGQMSARRN